MTAFSMTTRFFQRSHHALQTVAHTTTGVPTGLMHAPLFRAMHTTFQLGKVAAPVPAIPTFADTTVALKHALESYNPKEHHGRPLFVNDAGVVKRQYQRWTNNLPNVRPFYAVKCNPDAVILQQLADCNSGFDCATKAEIEAVLQKGVDPDDIIFANPVKAFADIEYARDHGVKKMTFDNESELLKIQEISPEAELVLRLLPDDSGSLMRFGVKFGASFEKAAHLLALSQQLNLKVIGVSFHIGSGCFDPHKYEDAIVLSRSVFDLAKELGLPEMTFLDIGGGFPGDPTPNQQGRDGVPSFEAFAGVIQKSIADHFPAREFPALQCISEPGRYFATAAGTLFAMVQGKRKDAEDKCLYYINDGVYGSFNSIMFDHAKPKPCTLEEFFVPEQAEQVPVRMHEQRHKKLVSASSEFSTDTRSQGIVASTIFGPTCDSIDLVVEDHPMRELHVGEWLVFDHMGAYTTAAASNFNGVPGPITTYVRSLE